MPTACVHDSGRTVLHPESIAMQSNLAGRVDNTVLKPTKALLPVFEAVVNSIHAVQDANRSPGRIKVELVRHPQADLAPALAADPKIPLADVYKVIVEDDGIGFTQDNFDAFDTLDTRAKLARGGKGIGRLTWLKAFERAEVRSLYRANGQWQERRFDFVKTQRGIQNHKKWTPRNDGFESSSWARVTLDGYRPEYRPYVPRTAEGIGRKIVEHCIAYYVLESAPQIRVVDLAAKQDVDLTDLFHAEFKPEATRRTIAVKDESLEIIDVYIRSSEAQHRLNLCADDRVVEEILLSPRLPYLEAPLKNERGENVMYHAYVLGDLLDRHVNSARTGFDLDSRDSGRLQLYGDVTRDDVLEASLAAVRDYLAPKTEEQHQASMRRIRDYASEREPRYRVLLTQKADAIAKLPGNLSDDRLDTELHRMLSDYKHEVRNAAKQRLENAPDDASSFALFREGFTALLGDLTEIAKSDLVDYVVHRATVLAFLDKLLKANELGKVEPESELHSLFFPMRRTSDEVDYDEQNLWLIDERLAYHRYLASDKPFAEQDSAPVTVDSDDRPDLLVYNNPHAFVPSDPPFTSVVLVEFKKPERADYAQEGKSPIAQVLRYIDRIRSGSARRPDGTIVERPASVPFYCYIVATMTPALEKDAKERGFVETPDAMGWFHFNQNFNAYIEVLSYRKVLGDAQKRNAAFFHKLNIHPRP